MKTTFIYFLRDPINPIKGYVGKSDNPKGRCVNHLVDSRKNKRTCWLKSLATRQLKPVLEVIAKVADDNWEFWERSYIRAYLGLGFDLMNGTAGGDGGATMAGKQHSQATREKQSAAQSGEKGYWFGKKQSPETCTKKSEIKLGKKKSDNTSGFVGVSWSNWHKKWRAQFQHACLGHFSKIEDAVFARALALENHLTNLAETRT